MAEWSLARFDAFVPLFPDSDAEVPFPRSVTPTPKYLVPLGVGTNTYCVQGMEYPLDGSVALSSSASYLVITHAHRKDILKVVEPPENIIVLEEFITGLPILPAHATAREQEEWIAGVLEYLCSELRADPKCFRTAQASWRHHAIRRIGRDWKQYNIKQNEFWFTHEHSPFSEAFVFTENRKDRNIVACDLRSAYGWALGTQDYPSPTTWSKVDSLPSESTTYVALCRLSKPTTWLSKHHPWSYTEHGNTIPFYWASTDTVVGWFTGFELKAIQGLCEVEVIAVYAPDNFGAHPMSSQIKKWFENRKESNEYEKCWKTKIASAHTWSISYKNETVSIDSFDQVIAERFIARRFIAGKRMAYQRYDNEIGTISYVHQGPSVGIWLPHVWTALLVRTRVFSLMRWAHENVPNCDCAYVNVDELHWSIPSKDLESFKEKISNSEWQGDSMGQARIDYISKSGIWFKPGVYILYNSADEFHTSIKVKPWACHRASGFWTQNLQVYHNLIGSPKRCLFQRPRNIDLWANPKKIVTQNIMKYTRRKKAIWHYVLKKVDL